MRQDVEVRSGVSGPALRPFSRLLGSEAGGDRWPTPLSVWGAIIGAAARLDGAELRPGGGDDVLPVRSGQQAVQPAQQAGEAGTALGNVLGRLLLVTLLRLIRIKDRLGRERQTAAEGN